MKIVAIHNHDSFNSELCKIPGTEWFHLVNERHGHKLWGAGSRPVPDNLHALPYENLSDIDWSAYDVCIVHSLDRYELLRHVPIKKIYLEHTLPYPLYAGAPHQDVIMQDPLVVRVVFLSDEQVTSWRIKNPLSVEVIPSCIDVSLYPEWQGDRETVLTVVNELPNREWCCGYNTWNTCTNGLPRTLLGCGNEGIPKNDVLSMFDPTYNVNAAGFKTHEEIQDYFVHSRVYFNTNLYSTLPFALMEAMAYGMPIVSTNRNTAKIYLDNVARAHKGRSAVLSNIPFVLRQNLVTFLKTPDMDMLRAMGQEARKNAIEYFDPQRFIEDWKAVLEYV